MPLYRFDWVLGGHRIYDRSGGIELPDDEAARQHAVDEIRELMSTTIGSRLAKDCGIEICDENRRVLFILNCDGV